MIPITKKKRQKKKKNSDLKTFVTNFALEEN